MSDLVIFIVGTGVFAVTTTATLLYGYVTFQKKARDDGIFVAEDAATETEADIQDPSAGAEPTAISIEIARVGPSSIPDFSAAPVR